MVKVVDGSGDLCEQLKAKLNKKLTDGVLVSSTNGQRASGESAAKKSMVKNNNNSNKKSLKSSTKKEVASSSNSNKAKKSKKSVEKAKLIAKSLNKKLKKSRSGNLDSELRSSIEGPNRSEIYEQESEDDDEEEAEDEDEQDENEKNEGEAGGGGEENSEEDDDAASEEVCAVEKCLRPTGKSLATTNHVSMATMTTTTPISTLTLLIPTGSIKWVQCDGGCNRWFHLACVGRTRIGKKENYWCPTCTEARQNSTPPEMPQTTTTTAANLEPEASANDDSQLSNTSTNGGGGKRTRNKQNGGEIKRFKEVQSDEDNPASSAPRLIEQIH